MQSFSKIIKQTYLFFVSVLANGVAGELKLVFESLLSGGRGGNPLFLGPKSKRSNKAILILGNREISLLVSLGWLVNKSLKILFKVETTQY